MVLADLGRGITSALQKLHGTARTDISQATIDAVIADICRSLLQNDVHIKLVSTLRGEMRAALDMATLPAGVSVSRVATKTMYDCLLNIVDTPPCTFKPVRGSKKPNVVMAVGLQGSGKTTTCSKMAHYYRGKGFRVGLVAADTFRAGAIDQLHQNAMKVRVPFYSDRTCVDPVVVARDGVNVLGPQCDIVIVDTSGRHCQDDDLFAEMKEIQDAVRPDLVFLVLNADIGQAAETQARAFFRSTNFGAIVITKMDGSGKGGGALSAVAATKVPILFIGMGEHMDDLHSFTPEGFVKKLMGVGDMVGLTKTLQEHIAQRDYEVTKGNVVGTTKKKGHMCWAELREYYETMNSMGDLSDVISMIPGLGAADVSATTKSTRSNVKVYMVILDSMTLKEAWDGTGKILPELAGDALRGNSRWRRIVRGSGRSWDEVEDLVRTKRTTQSLLAKTTSAKGLSAKGVRKGGGGGGGGGGMGDIAALLGGGGGGGGGVDLASMLGKLRR